MKNGENDGAYPDDRLYPGLYRHRIMGQQESLLFQRRLLGGGEENRNVREFMGHLNFIVYQIHILRRYIPYTLKFLNKTSEI